MAKGSVVGPLPEPIESIDKYAALLEKIKAMIEEAIDEAFADHENPAEFYELIQNYVTAPTLTKILKQTYQSFMKAGKMFVVWQAGSGDGIYDCYEQGLLNAEWHDTDGDSKFASKNAISVEVLNLGEYNPHGTYVAALIAGDLLMSWQLIDNLGIIRWVGVPFNQDNADRPRVAYCKTAAEAGSTIVCYLDTNTTGTEITVNCNISGGSDLNKAIRRLAIGNIILVTKIGTSWYCTEGFQTISDGLIIDGGVLKVDVDTTKGIEIAAGKVAAKIDTTKGIEFVTGKIAAKIDTDELQFDSGAIKTKLDECPLG